MNFVVNSPIFPITTLTYRNEQLQQTFNLDRYFTPPKMNPPNYISSEFRPREEGYIGVSIDSENRKFRLSHYGEIFLLMILK